MTVGPLLKDRHLLVTGILSESSIAAQVARIAQDEGASLLATSPAKTLAATQRVVKRLGLRTEVVPFDVTSAEDLANLATALDERWPYVDGALHSIGFAPARCFGNTVMNASWDDVAAAMHVSCYSLRVLADVVRPRMTRGGSIVALSVDPSVAWPYYDWMGVTKAALECLARYLARDLGPEGIRVNVVRAGPLRTVASRAVPRLLPYLSRLWDEQAPLGWSPNDAVPVAEACVMLLSNRLSMTTGEVLHVDGGMHAVGGAPEAEATAIVRTASAAVAT
jgi:enoyl-[acyl-carrier protein] reductase I